MPTFPSVIYSFNLLSQSLNPKHTFMYQKIMYGLILRPANWQILQSSLVVLSNGLIIDISIAIIHPSIMTQFNYPIDTVDILDKRTRLERGMCMRIGAQTHICRLTMTNTYVLSNTSLHCRVVHLYRFIVDVTTNYIIIQIRNMVCNLIWTTDFKAIALLGRDCIWGGKYLLISSVGGNPGKKTAPTMYEGAIWSPVRLSLQPNRGRNFS